MSLEPIRNDFAREEVMETLLQHTAANKDLAVLIRKKTLRDLKKLHPSFRDNWRVVTATTASRQNLVKTREDLLLKLEQVARHFRNCLIWRTERMKHGPAILRMYLPMGGMQPNMSVPRDVVKLAEFLVEGEEVAVAMGYPPMTNPSAADIVAWLPDTKAAVLAVEIADLNQAEAQENLRTDRMEADSLLRTIARQIQMELDGKSESHTRRVMRRLGYRFTTPERNATWPTDSTLLNLKEPIVTARNDDENEAGLVARRDHAPGGKMDDPPEATAQNGVHAATSPSPGSFGERPNHGIELGASIREQTWPTPMAASINCEPTTGKTPLFDAHPALILRSPRKNMNIPA